MKEIIEFLFDSDYRFVCTWTNKKTYGDINPRKNRVRINVRLMLMETLLHEFYHYKYPKAPEVTVEYLAQAKTQELTKKEIFFLTDWFVDMWGKGANDE